MKKNNILNACLTGAMILSTAMPVCAASRYTTDSVGSVAGDITNSTKTGVDAVQSKKSEYHNEVTADKAANNCNVYVTKASTFSVVIPKTIVLNGTGETSNKGVYSVSVKGNIAGDDVISVVPTASFEMSQSGKKNIPATVTQPKTTFQINDGLVTEANVQTGNTVTGEVQVTKLTSGSWNGNFNFTIGIATGTAINPTP